MTSANVSNGGGIVFDSPIARAYNRTGSTVLRGQLVQFDITLSSTEATGFVAVSSGLDPIADGFANVVATTDIRSGISAIALEDVADNAIGRFQIEGIVRHALVQHNAGGTPGTDVQAGTVEGSAAANLHLHAGAANTTKALAITLGFMTSETVATDIPVYFNGSAGIGTP